MMKKNITEERKNEGEKKIKFFCFFCFSFF